MEKRYPIVSKEYMQAVEKARQKLRGLMYKELCAPLMIRVACHFAAAYGVNASTSGSMMTNANKQDDTDTDTDDDGLSIALRLLSPLKKQFPIISHADFYQLVGVVAVEVTGGPDIPFHPGRKDKDNLPVVGLLPNENKGDDHLRDVYVKTLGLDDTDVVTLSAGYDLRASDRRPPFGSERSRSSSSLNEVAYKKRRLESGVLDTRLSVVFDNFFFKNLLALEDKDHMPPPAYIALLKDRVFRALVERYAADEDAFFADYAVSHMKLSELGFADA